MSGKRYPEEFKREAVKQVTQRGHKIGDVARRLGTTSKSLNDWIKKYGVSDADQKEANATEAELKKLKAELRRVTEERDILKEAAVDSTGRCNTYSNSVYCSEVPDEANLFPARAILSL